VIIPRPVKAHAHPDAGRVKLTADGFVIAADEASRPTAGLLRAALDASTGWGIVAVPVTSDVRPNAVTLTVGLPCGGRLPDDGYRLRAASDEGYFYLDWAHSDDKSEPLAIRGATSVADVYTFDPIPRGLSEGARRNIIGAQAQLWTEYISDTGLIPDRTAGKGLTPAGSPSPAAARRNISGSGLV
jgi:hypothetical protein